MRDDTLLHFDLSHLAADQPFTLRAGRDRCRLRVHDDRSRARARRDNRALRLLPDHRVTHYAQPRRLPHDAPMLMHVTAPRLRPDDLLDRLVLSSLYVPHRHRRSALKRLERKLGGAPVPWPPQLGDAPPGGLPPDDVLIDIGDYTSAMNCAQALVFHHGELLTVQGAQAAYIVSNIIAYADGINALAQSILDESTAHEADASTPNWVSSVPGTNWTTGQPDPAHPVYHWSDATSEYLAAPVRDALQTAKDDPELENQCWTVLPGITQVAMSPAPAAYPAATAAEADYTVREITPQCGVSSTFAYDQDSSTATVSLSNAFLRWLQVSVDQYAPGSSTPLGTTSYLGMLSPPDTMMAAPIPTEATDFPFVFDPRADHATVTYGGLGQPPYDWTYDRYGLGCTIVFNYAVPLTFIALGVAVDQGGKAWSDLAKQVVPAVVAAVEAAAEGPLASATAPTASLYSVTLAVANLSGALLLGVIAGSDALKAYLAAAIGESGAEECEPFLGWAALAIGAAADLASICETTVAVASSPALMALSVQRTMDVAVTVHSDPRHPGQWPAVADQYSITVTYDDGPVHSYDATFDPKNTPDPIAHTFTGLPAGGNATVTASFFSATGWIAGQGRSAALNALPTDGDTMVVPDITITENQVPLTATTTYSFLAKLAYGPSGRSWAGPPAASAPTATVSDLDGSPIGNNLGALAQITLNEPLATLGYAWQASGQNVPLKGTGDQPYSGQEYTFQALGAGSAPQGALKFSPAAYVGRAGVAFPPPTMANPLADGFLLEPDDATAMYLRPLSLASGTPFIATPDRSFARFAGPQDDLAIHPAGYAVALCLATSKLQVARLTGTVADADAPDAAILAGQGTRAGLLDTPVAVACGPANIIVLQTTDAAPQGALAAFDVKGNPVGCFAGGASSVALRTESLGVTPVDVSVESKGYIYVLKYLTEASGTVAAGDYRLDIHNPDGSFLVQVAGIAAAALHVDLWRNVFTLDYEILPGSGRTEPSVAEWIPSTPEGSDRA